MFFTMPREKETRKTFSCYLDEQDLARAKRIAKKEMSNMSAVVRRAVRIGLQAIEAGTQKC